MITLTKTQGILLVGATAIFCHLGDIFLKRASQRASPFTSVDFFLGMLVFAVTSVAWVFAFMQLKYAAIGLVYGVTTVLFSAIIGWAVFHEPLTPREWLGLALGIVSIILLDRPD